MMWQYFCKVRGRADQHSALLCLSSYSPAGRRSPDADGGGEGEKGSLHGDFTADPRTAGAETQPDSHEGRGLTETHT